MRQIALQVSIALAAGMFSIVPVVEGAPVGGEVKAGGAAISYSTTASGVDTAITSNATNNVIDWQDFSVANGEKVTFDGGNNTNNYMNIVSGANTSEINGAIVGGNDVYIINPNGVIFGENASVNVGSLYASTRYVSADAAVAAATAGNMTTVLANPAAGVATDVVNLGSVSADKVVLEGANIRLLNSEKVTITNATDTNPNANVKLIADTDNGGYIHVGNSTGGNVGYTATALDGDTITPTYYMLVNGSNWFSAINQNLAGNYMLSADIDADTEAYNASTNTGFDVITGIFSGNIEGNFHKISNIRDARGLFSNITGTSSSQSRIDNLGITDSTFTGISTINVNNAVGSVAAQATYTILNNVYNKNSSSDATVKGPARYTGGLVGAATNVTIENSYNTANVSGVNSSSVAVGGLMGGAVSGTNTINNSYSTGTAYGSVLGHLFAGTANVTNTYSTGNKFIASDVASATSNVSNSLRYNNGGYYNSSEETISSNKINTLSLYSSTLGWGSDISNTGGVTINTTTGVVTRPAWRIYEGQTQPLLTSFLKGIKTTNYKYGYFTSDGTADTAATLYNGGVNGISKSFTDGNSTYTAVVAGEDMPAYSGVNSDDTPNGLVYNGEYLKLVDSNGNAATVNSDGVLNDAMVAFTTKGNSTIDTSHVFYDSAGRKDATATVTSTTTDGVTTYDVTQNKLALLYSDQSGYDLVGNNIAIAPRAITTSTSLNTQTVVKEYDGTANASGAVSNGLFNGDSTTVNGILSTDTDVTLNFDGTATFYSNGAEASAVGLYQFTDADTATQYVNISGTISLTNGGNNYYLTGNSNTISGKAQGAITQKAITVNLANTTFEKTYDKNAIAKGVDSDNNEINGGAVVSTDFTFGDGTATDINSSLVSTTSGTTPTYEDVSLDFDTTAYYVDGNGDQISSAGPHDVKFGGLKLSGNDAGNYKLVDSSGNVLYSKNPLILTTTDASGTVTAYEDSGDYTAGGALYGFGTIGKRNISSTGFLWYDSDGAAQDATREYNGLVTYTDPVNYTVSNASNSTGDSGMLEGDRLTFTVQSAKFVTSSTDLTAASTKNAGTAAGVLYTVQITGDAASNYTLDGADINTSGTNYVIGEGSITPRTIKLSAVTPDSSTGTAYAVKSYDGDALVKVTESDGTKRTALTLADGFLAYTDVDDTDHHLLDDGSSIVITGNYLQTYRDTAAKDVNYSVTSSTNDNETTYTYAVADKNITYTAVVNDENGDASSNYVFDGTNNATTADFTVANGGRIKPVAITALEFAAVSKTYDGDYDVTNTVTNTAPLLTDDRITFTSATGLVDGETIGDLFGSNVVEGDSGYQLAEGSTLLTGQYGTLNNGVFSPDENVARDNYGNVIAKDVKYSGISNLLANRNYTLSSDISDTAYGEGTINPFAITDADWIVLNRNSTPITKVYDGSEEVAGYTTDGTAVTATTYLGTADNSAYAYVTPDNGNTVLNATVTVAGANYASKHSNGNTAQNVTYLITMANTGNYTLAESILNDSNQVEKVLTNEGTITPRPITIEDSDIVNSNITKEYDGTNYVGGNTAGAISGENLITFEDQMISGDGNSNATTAIYNDATAGDKTVNYALTISGEDPTDYYFKNSSGGTITTYAGAGTIEKRTLGVTFGDVTKVYDSTTAVTDTITPTVSNALAADEAGITAALAGVNAVYDDANVASGKTVTYSGLTAALGDTYGTNYKFANDSVDMTNGAITTASVSMSDFVFRFEDVERVYNGYDTVADSAQGITAEGFVTGHYIDLGTGTLDFDYTITSAVFNNKNVDTEKNVTYTITITQPDLTNFTITDFDSNYFVTNPVSANVGTITPKPVYASVTGTHSKTYDRGTDVKSGTTVLTGDSLVNFDGLVSGDSNTTTAVYTDWNQDTNKIINYTLSIDDGNNGNNYVIYDAADRTTEVSTLSNAGNVINPLDLQISFGDVTKVYDGTTDVLASEVSPTFTTVLAGDSISLRGYNAEYNSPDVADATTVYYSNITLNGNDAGNYNLVDANGNTVDSDSTVNGNGTISRLALSGDLVFTIGDVTKEYDKNPNVAYDGDYDLSTIKTQYINAPTLNINGSQQALPYTLDSAQYDDYSVGTVPATFKIGLSSDNYTFDNVNVKYKIGDAGTENAVNAVMTDGVYNYSFVDNVATITPRKVYLAVQNTTPISKTYDGYATLDESDAAAMKVESTSNVYMPDETNFITDDDVAIKWSTISANYNDKDAGDKTVYYTVSLDGTSANNYELYRADDSTAITANNLLTGTGKIEKAVLSVNFNPMDKTYNGSSTIDGLTAADVVLTGVSSDGTIAFTDAIVAANIHGNYGTKGSTANAFADDGNVSWDDNGYADSNILDKPILYTGLSDALAAMVDADANSVFKNYTIVDTAYFTATQEKGQIRPIAITNAAVANWVPITREYDATQDVYGVAIANPAGGTLTPKDILTFTVVDDNGDVVTNTDGTAMTLDYTTSSTQFDNKGVSDNRTLNYVIDEVTKGIADNSGNINYVLSDTVVDGLAGSEVSSANNNIITTRQLNGSVVSATGQRKIYDGKDSADKSNFVLDSDDLAVLGIDGLTADITAIYNDVNATVSPTEADANALTVTYTLSLNNSNYAIATPTATATGDIERRKVYVQGDNVIGIDKEYNGNDSLPENYSSTGRFSLVNATTDTGRVLGEEDIQLDIDAITGKYASANVKRGSDGSVATHNINFTGFSLIDTDSTNNDRVNNYVVSTMGITGSGTIKPKEVTVSVKNAPTKEYDGTDTISADYAADSNLQVDGLVGDDTANVLIDKAVYENAKADTGKNYTYDLTLGNTNYSFVNGTIGNNGLTTVLSGSDGIITPRTITPTVDSSMTKEYDGTTAGTDDAIDMIGLDRVIAGDDTGLSVIAQYDNEHARNADGSLQNHTVTYSMGISNSNYQLSTDSITGNGTITPKALTITVNSAPTKEYDGTTSLSDDYATINNLTVKDVVDGDEDIIMLNDAYYDDANAGTGKGYVYSLSLNNTDYSFDSGTVTSDGLATTLNGTNGVITPRIVDVTVSGDMIKEYDGTTKGAENAANNITLSRVLADDDAGLIVEANYTDANAGTAKDYTYTLSLSNGNYAFADGDTSTISGSDGVITPRVINAVVNGTMTKEYDGTTDGIENALANVSVNRVLSGDTLGLKAVATYDNPNAGISEDSDELQEHEVTYTLNLTNPNYQLVEDTIVGVGTISRKGLNIVATPAAVNTGEAMPEFSGTVEGLVDSDSGFAGLFTFAPESTTTTNLPGSYGVYGWYSNRVSGNLGLNYTFAQAGSNDTAFTVNYVNNTDNPDTKITPNSDIYQQISKDMNSGFGDNGLAAIEYVDKSGNVIASESISSGEIHATGIESATGVAELSTDDTSLATIGIVGGDIVNLEGADAASTANIEVDGDGSIVNLEVFSVDGDKQSVAGNASTEIVSTDSNSNAAMEIRTVDSDGVTDSSIQIVDESGNVWGENEEDKVEKKEKEGEIAIESSDDQDDEIELKIEDEGVNVA